MKRAALSFAALALLTACGKRPNDQKRPTSSLTQAQAIVAANAAAASHRTLTTYTVAETHSMEPVIYGNAVVLVEPVRIGEIQVGDIILFRRADSAAPVMHQVFANNGVRLGVAGVNNYANDTSESVFITDVDLVGRYCGQIVFRHP